MRASDKSMAHFPGTALVIHPRVSGREVIVVDAAEGIGTPPSARSPHHVAAVFEHAIGIRLNGKGRLDVSEYCISAGWVKVPAGKTLDLKGNPLFALARPDVKVGP